MTRILSSVILLLLAGVVPAAAAAGGHDHLPLHAEEFVKLGPFVITNSMIMVWLVAAAIILVAQLATRDMKLIPSGLQNAVEWLVESLYNFLEGILGADLVKKTFWFFGSIFILILFVNWAGLVPGVGTVGWKLTGTDVDPYDSFLPWLRGGNADLNMTVAMSVTFTVLWLYWAVRENTAKGVFAHIFAPKGDFKGLIIFPMIIVFGFVGVLEVVSILFRPVALSFRLFGNVYAGENILENMLLLLGTGDWKEWVAGLIAIPFYFLELLVGLIQALVFTLLTSVFLKLICDHGDHGDEDHAH